MVADGECVNCNLCEMICPDFAIYCIPADGQPTGSVAEAQAEKEDAN